MHLTMTTPVLSFRYAVALSIIFLFSTFRVQGFTSPPIKWVSTASALYHSIDPNHHEAPPYDVFLRALSGYDQLATTDKLSNKGIITVIDFRRSANEKRLWVIDLLAKKILFHSLTAHGRNSGEVFARHFSNTPNSNKSSLGFYVTGKTYVGKHGISLKLHGIETGINDKAEARAIVMHGASYVSESHIKRYGRIGRSLGCPAVPMETHKEIISQIANGTCLFIFYPDPAYVAASRFKSSEEAQSL